MINTFENFNINITAIQQEKLNLFKKLLIFYNNSFNITSIIEDKDIIIKHFFDSIAGESYFKKEAKVIEIGSGGGFPSIPLKIIREDLIFTLNEATGKKCQFLNTVIKELDLKNIEVINDRAEILAKNQVYREKYDVATARAVAKLNTLSEYCMPFVKTGGLFIAYKGESAEEITEAQNAIKVLGGKLQQVYSYELLENYGKRNLIIIEKINNCDKKYPRGQGKERSKPL
jgi:16S rRNA (guanine527-N7)-methyltransferase